MAVDATILLQVVALSLPAIAILMQAILYVQDDGDGVTRLYTEFRFLEISFVLLVFSAGAFAFELSRSVDSPVIFFGLTLMTLAFILVIPATVFGLRRGMADISPEHAIVSFLEDRQVVIVALLAGAVALVIMTAVVANLLIFASVQAIMEFMLLVTAAVVAASAVIVSLNRHIQNLTNKRERYLWIEELQQISVELLNHIKSVEDPGWSFHYDPGFRGTFRRLVDQLIDVLESPPEDIDIDTTEYESQVQMEMDELSELPQVRERAEDYLDQVEEKINSLQSHITDVELQIAEARNELEDSERTEDKDEIWNTLNRLETEHQDLKDELERFKQNMAEAQASLDESLNLADDSITTIKEVAEELNSKISEI